MAHRDGRSNHARRHSRPPPARSHASSIPSLLRSLSPSPHSLRLLKIAARILTAIWPALLVLTTHVCTLAPTVTGEDSGELITAAYFFGVPHPPGYPLWTMLCGAWTHLIPFGSIAWRANLFSAVCTAGAVQCLYVTLIRMRFRPSVSGCAAAACGLTSAVWSQSVITEVYTLNLLLTAILIYLVARWHDDGNRFWLVWGALTFGLGMSNHHIIGFAALGVFLWAVMIRPDLLRDWRLAVCCVAVFLVGLLPYTYLLWAAQRDVPVKWGETTTPATVWEHASRGQYKSETSVNAEVPMTSGLMVARLFYGLRWEVSQFTPYLTPLLVAGLIRLWQRMKCDKVRMRRSSRLRDYTSETQERERAPHSLHDAVRVLPNPLGARLPLFFIIAL